MKAKLKPLHLVVTIRKLVATDKIKEVKVPIRIDYRTIIYVSPTLTKAELEAVINKYKKKPSPP